MYDFFNQPYEVGDIIYYVVAEWDKHLVAKQGKILKVDKKTLTIEGPINKVVIRSPQRHVNITKIKTPLT